MTEPVTADLLTPRTFAAALEARFFARRFFTGRVMRRERRFSVKIPLPLPQPT